MQNGYTAPNTVARHASTHMPARSSSGGGDVIEIDISRPDSTRARQEQQDAQYARRLYESERDPFGTLQSMMRPAPPAQLQQRVRVGNENRAGSISTTNTNSPARLVRRREPNGAVATTTRRTDRMGGTVTTTTSRNGGMHTSRTERRTADGGTMITSTVVSGGNGGGTSMTSIEMGSSGGSGGMMEMMATAMMGSMITPRQPGMIILHPFDGDEEPQQIPLGNLMGGLQNLHSQSARIDEIGGFGGLLGLLMGGGVNREMANDPQHERWWRHRLRGANQNEINNLPTHKIKKTKSKGSKTDDYGSSHDQSSCQICLEEFGAGDNIRTLPCLHIYHKQCIDQWLVRNRTCPICKASI